MDYSKHDTNKSNANNSLENGQKGKRKGKHRSEKQVERCRKYRERQSTETWNNAVAEVDKYTYGQHTNVYPRVPVPPFQITCLSVPRATLMHQPFYFFSPRVIQPAHISENEVLSASIPQEDKLQPNSASAKYQETCTIFHPGSILAEDSSGLDNRNQDDEEAGNHDNDKNADDTLLDKTVLSSNENNDYDMVGIMSVFANSSLHCVLDTTTHFDDKPGKDFGYVYFTISNLLK